MASRIMKGTVVSTKMEKTAVVQIEFSKIHPVYGRRYKMHTKLKAHYEGFELNEGDFVTIQEVAKISKTKSWMVRKPEAKKVKSADKKEKVEETK
jgi:small subunit ribosomal protein S17